MKRLIFGMTAAALVLLACIATYNRFTLPGSWVIDREATKAAQIAMADDFFGSLADDNDDAGSSGGDSLAGAFFADLGATVEERISKAIDDTSLQVHLNSDGTLTAVGSSPASGDVNMEGTWSYDDDDHSSITLKVNGPFPIRGKVEPGTLTLTAAIFAEHVKDVVVLRKTWLGEGLVSSFE